MNRSKKPCQHPRWTVPIKMLIKAEDSQEIIGEALLQVCCDCGHTKGVISNGSGFNPSGNIPFICPIEANLGYEARKVLNSQKTYLTRQPTWVTPNRST